MYLNLVNYDLYRSVQKLILIENTEEVLKVPRVKRQLKITVTTIISTVNCRS